MEPQHLGRLDGAELQLAGELADVEAAIALVAGGTVSAVTLTRMRFGRQLADHLEPEARRVGVHLDTTFWPEDSACDIHVRPESGHLDG